MELKPTLGQRTNFITYAKQDEHLNIFDWETERLEEMSLTEFNFLKRCWYDKKYFEMKKILEKYINLK